MIHNVSALPALLRGITEHGSKNMNFGEQFKKLRTERQLTQEQVAAQLNISRQAVSNWENNKNLPDIEMIVEISKKFSISLDRLILGGEEKNNMTEKLIRDGNETRRARINLISVCIGTLLLLLGAGCILIKACSVEYIDAAGVLHENFFLLPIGFLFMFSGLAAFAAAGMRNLIDLLRKRRQEKKQADDSR